MFLPIFPKDFNGNHSFLALILPPSLPFSILHVSCLCKHPPQQQHTFPCIPAVYCQHALLVFIYSHSGTLLCPAPLPGPGEPFPASVTVIFLSKSLCTFTSHSHLFKARLNPLWSLPLLLLSVTLPCSNSP